MFSQLILPKIRLIIYYNKFKTSNIIISNNSSRSTELLGRTSVIYMFKCSLEDCVSNENNTYFGLITKTLTRRITMCLNDSSTKALHLNTHSIPKSKFQKILVENFTIISREINKLRQQILEAIHIKTKKLESIELILKIATMFWNAFSFFLIFYFSW